MATAGSLDENAKLGQREGVTWPTLKFWNPLHISETWKVETSNLAHKLAAGCRNEKYAKLGQRESDGVMWPPVKILGLLRISGTVESKNFKFGMQIGHSGS